MTTEVITLVKTKYFNPIYTVCMYSMYISSIYSMLHTYIRIYNKATLNLEWCYSKCILLQEAKEIIQMSVHEKKRVKHGKHAWSCTQGCIMHNDMTDIRPPFLYATCCLHAREPNELNAWHAALTTPPIPNYSSSSTLSLIHIQNIMH